MDVDLAPKATFRAAMLTGVPFTFAFRLDARLSIRRCKGPEGPRNGMATFSAVDTKY
jgi:hypothetical protein